MIYPVESEYETIFLVQFEITRDIEKSVSRFYGEDFMVGYQIRSFIRPYLINGEYL